MSTVAAISTASANGAIGVIRISGEHAATIADSVFRPVNPKKTLVGMTGYTAAFGHTFDAQGDIDEAVALKYNAPYSYTGEQTVELSLHGGELVLRRTLRAVLSAGAKPAAAGEFTRRAFLNGKLSLTQAEAVMDIIGARSASALSAANAAKNGAVYKAISMLCKQLVAVAATLAAAIDFPEEGEPVDVDYRFIENELTTVSIKIKQLIDSYGAVCNAKNGIDCVIVGRPNVGKSTLMNLLTGYERSIVTSEEGTTRDVVEECVTVDGMLLRLSDTAGLRQGRSLAEQLGIERTENRISTAQLLLAVFAADEPLSDEDISLLERTANQPRVIIVNKTDITDGYDERLRECGKPVEISAATGGGVAALYRAIREKINARKIDENDGFIANERQLDAARRALAATEQAAREAAARQTADALSVLTEDAIAFLLELSGERASERVVSEVFEKFCVGK